MRSPSSSIAAGTSTEDHGRVEQQRDRDAEAHLLEHHEVAGGEADEDDDDDQRAPVISREVVRTPNATASLESPVCV